MDIGLCALMTGIEIDYHIGWEDIKDNLTQGRHRQHAHRRNSKHRLCVYAEDSWTRYVDESLYARCCTTHLPGMHAHRGIHGSAAAFICGYPREMIRSTVGIEGVRYSRHVASG